MEGGEHKGGASNFPGTTIQEVQKSRRRWEPTKAILSQFPLMVGIEVALVLPPVFAPTLLVSLGSLYWLEPRCDWTYWQLLV